ncbi:unnamed protein product, partial [marine sediment metagenome]
MEVHQFATSLSYGDAISNEMMEIRQALKEEGYCSEIFVKLFDPRMAKHIKDYREYKKFSSSQNVVIFHFSIGSPVSKVFFRIPDKKIMIYHNITPYEYFLDYHRGDAIGDTATYMKQYFLSQGFESQIYCLTRDDGLENESELFDNFKAPSAGDMSFFHFALPSPLTPAFIKLKSKKVILYHNITPEKYFTDYSQEMARLCRRGRDELRSLTPYVDLALADSEFNRRELLEFGFKKTAVFPLFVDYKKYEKPLRANSGL